MVSSSDDFYNVIQYGDILETVGDAAERHGIQPEGQVSVSPTAHKMTADLDLGSKVYADQDDAIELGLRVRSGHSGFHGLKYDVGAERQVCSNGMTSFISELGFEQTHGEPFQPGVAYNAVDAVVESPAEIEHRLAQAQNRELLNQDEALLVLLDTGIDRYLEDPVPDLLNALQSEVEDSENPTLWETYNAGTRALTHYSSEPEYDLAEGFERAARLLENGTNQIPDPETLGKTAVDRRTRDLIESGDSEPYWPEERKSLRELMEKHGIEA
ncbi:DUF932 domain-containing protein [Haloarcula mannanilytica]|uniref:DUF932 domain-containing protein n=1 Tax=Haloarcula mannanilytica TaxID=2509225 RepID=UPI001F16400A|nr:DUF932 domain-containing protein [Haloarcula mannanilytica]